MPTRISMQAIPIISSTSPKLVSESLKMIWLNNPPSIKDPSGSLEKYFDIIYLFFKLSSELFLIAVAKVRMIFGMAKYLELKIVNILFIGIF